SSTSEPTTVVGVDAEKPGKAARELVTTISSSSAGCCSGAGAGVVASSAAYAPVAPASRRHVTVNPSGLIRAPQISRHNGRMRFKSQKSARLISKTYQRDL